MAGDAHHLHRHREVQLGLGPGGQGSTTGTASSRTSPISTSTTRTSCSAVIRVMRYWLDMGVDGMRLDAIPYLCERDGTNNENLPETHAVLKHDARRARRALPRTGSSSPRRTSGRRTCAEYFGDGDECHMAFHFPLMPRMYMAIAQEDRHPVVDIMQQTPDIPEDCQWAIFLRNHDELTLEMVTSRERDYMYQHVRRRPARAHQPRHPPPARAAHGERSGPDQAHEQPAAVDARLAHHLLRRRDRHGRQHLPRRPQRRAHADAVEPGPQRRVLARRPAAALPAADHGPDLRLRGRQRRGADARPVLAPQLDEAHARRAQGEPARSAAGRSRSCGPGNRKILAYLREYGDDADPVRGEPRALGAAGRARPRALQGPRSGRDARPHARSRRSASCPTC